MRSIKINLMVILIMLSFGIQSNISAQSRDHDANVPTTTEIVILFEGDSGTAYQIVGAHAAGAPGDGSVESSSGGELSGDGSLRSSSGGELSGDGSLRSSSGPGSDNGGRFEFGEGFFGPIGRALNAFFDALGL